MTIKQLALGVLCIWMTACGTQTPGHSNLSADTEASRFPLNPNPDMTPGETCQRPDTYRYPEKIAYCERDVSSSTKYAIIDRYDQEFGYTIGQMNRGDFKIDHYIPLCMGGSNSTKNLWPQHKTVYVKTDSLEQKLCELMAAGKMLQAEAMEKIRFAKNHLDEAAEMDRELDRLLGRD